MGSSRGWVGLIHTPANYERVTFEALEPLSPAERVAETDSAFRDAKMRMPGRKAHWVGSNFERVVEMGGLEAVREALLATPGAKGKIAFLQQFDGIGPKYARNILMDVYHPDFHDRIAIDQRIQKVSRALGVWFEAYEEHERFYIELAAEAGLNGWELDRILYHYTDDVLGALSGSWSPGTTIEERQRLHQQLGRTLRRLEESERLVADRPFGDGGVGMLFPRLKRAVLNQVEDGKAMVSRYGIWAMTARDHIEAALEHMDAGDSDAAQELLVKVANSLVGFAGGSNLALGLGHVGESPGFNSKIVGSATPATVSKHEQPPVHQLGEIPLRSCATGTDQRHILARRHASNEPTGTGVQHSIQCLPLPCVHRPVAVLVPESCLRKHLVHLHLCSRKCARRRSKEPRQPIRKVPVSALGPLQHLVVRVSLLEDLRREAP